MKLVNAYILFSAFLGLAGRNSAQAQDVWPLKRCLDSAQVYNKTLQVNRNTILVSEQKEKEAKANLLPRLIVNADYKYFTNLPYQLMPLSTFNPQAPEGQFKEAQFGVPHNINANLQLTMPLYNPQVYGAVQTSQVASEIAALQYQESAEQVYVNITTLYYNAQILSRQLSFLDSNLTNSNKLLQSMQLLQGQLLAKGTDVDKVKLQTEQLKIQQENARNQLTRVLNTLKISIGISLESNIAIDPDIKVHPETEYTNKTISDLQLARLQHNLLLGELHTLNRSRFLPSLNFIASYGTTGFGYDKQPNNFLKFYPVGFAGIQLSYPLFYGTVTLRKANQKKLELRNIELQSELLEEKNQMEITNAKAQRTIAQKNLSATEDQITLANTIYGQTLLQQKEGTASLTDVLLADNALRQAQQVYLAAVVDYLEADLELKRLTGNISMIK